MISRKHELCITDTMCHLDGRICKTDNSVLLKCLIENIEPASPKKYDVIVYDDFFILHAMVVVLLTFGEYLAKIKFSYYRY